ncbi:MAG: YaeQ family protein [Desulfotalea sp.]
MAIKPTIYKLRATISDSDRNFYDTISLTIAQHPSENLERVMARTIAYVLNLEENLSFTKGLSAVEEPDIWARTLDDRLSLWIDIGEPNSDRIRKASRQSPRVKIYTFNTKSDTWWSLSKEKLSEINVSVYQFNYSEIETLASLIKRSMDISITITGGIAYISASTGDCEVSCNVLQEKEA